MMRKDRYEQKKKRTGIVITVIMAFLMIASIFTIVIDNQSQGIPNYNGHKFVGTDYGYKTKINGQYMDFYYHPSDLERISMSPDIIRLINSSTGIAFVFNPEDNVSDNLQYVDIVRYDLSSQIDKLVYFGMTQESDKYQFTIVDCANATKEFPFVVMNYSVDTGFHVSQDNPYCIIMNAKFMELLAAKDRLVYSYYGIME